MRKLIFSINITLDGFIDHTTMIADDELHEKASELLRSADVVLYGRKAYQLMAEAWSGAPLDKTLSPRVREFADTMNAMEKIVYSTTLKNVSWKTKILRSVDPAAVRAMKRLPGKGYFIRSRSRYCTNLYEI
jgi:dihydrofolate reductase